VIADGRLSPVVAIDETDVETIGLWMSDVASAPFSMLYRPLFIQKRGLPCGSSVPKPALMRWLSPLLAVLLTVLSGALLFAALGQKPQGIHAFFIQPSVTCMAWSELLSRPHRSC
jgi:hypothetical protein